MFEISEFRTLHSVAHSSEAHWFVTVFQKGRRADAFTLNENKSSRLIVLFCNFELLGGLPKVG